MQAHKALSRPLRIASLLIALGASTVSAACARAPSPLSPSFGGSIGLPHHGLLSHASQLPASGPAHRWLTHGGHHFGTPQLVEAILFAAGEVQRARPQSPPLVVGDLSEKTGGKLPNHASHRTGRDADLLFYVDSTSGEPIASPGFMHFGPDGLAFNRSSPRNPYLLLDVDRNWLLVKALLRAPGPGVLWLFVSRPIEALITEHAFALGEDPELIWHAESVMLQPRNALPHDDHFHLRIACSPVMSVCGCEDIGPQWPWLAPPPVLEWPHSDDEIAALLENDATFRSITTAGTPRNGSP